MNISTITSISKNMRDLNQKGNDNSYAQEPNESDQHRATET